MKPRSNRFRASLLALAALTLAACGNKGPLTLPGEPTATKSKAAPASTAEQPADHNRPTTTQPR